MVQQMRADGLGELAERAAGKTPARNRLLGGTLWLTDGGTTDETPVPAHLDRDR